MLIISPRVSPYFDHMHRRFAAELPAKLTVVYTHQQSHWKADPTDAFARVSVAGPGDIDHVVSTSVGDHWREFRKGRRIIDVIDSEKPDVVLTHGYRNPGILRAIRHAHRRGIKTIVWSDVNAFGDAPTGFRRAFKRRYIAAVDSITDAWLYCGSRGRAYYQSYGVADSKTFCSPCEPNYRVIESASASDEFDHARRRFLFCGRFVSTKRAADVLNAFATLAPQMPQWDLVMLGDGELRQETIDRANDLAPGRVSFPSFQPDAAKVAAIFRACDVLVHVPEHEPWGLVINEAAAAGLAVVASHAVGAAAELVEHDRNGQVVTHGDAPSLQAAMLACTVDATLSRYQAASRVKLARWRDAADPVAGLKAALAYPSNRKSS